MSVFYPELDFGFPLPLLMGLGVGDSVYSSCSTDLLDERVSEAASSCFSAIGGFFSSLISATLNGSTLKGKLIRSVLAGAGAALLAFFVFSNPVGWAVGIGAAVFGVYLLAQLTIPTLIDAYKPEFWVYAFEI